MLLKIQIITYQVSTLMAALNPVSKPLQTLGVCNSVTCQHWPPADDILNRNLNLLPIDSILFIRKVSL